jgi:hypothetical protein
MTVTKSVIEVLGLLRKLNNKKINKYLEINKDYAKIKLEDSILCEINSDSITLDENFDVLNKITVDGEYDQKIESKQIVNFIKNISNSIIRLNHVGIAYFCTDIEKEINFYKKMLKNSKIKIYEEDSGDKRERWLFLGNLKDDWESPLFEVVLLDNSLIGGKGKFVHKLAPHFQIDLDTNFSFEELKKFIVKYLGPDFIDWKLDFLEGTVLVMGSLSSINGTKIRLGLATKLRNTKYHRKNILKEI